jgi:predicted GIY-YIG superfamily endonuclease
MKTGFFYVYILKSESDPPHFYTGFTEDLKSRFKHHNSGGDPHTAKFRPWRIKTAIAFTDREQAPAFERYLKSPSGRAFARKRL